MNGKDIELSRRRVLGGVATIGAASAAAGAGTFAYFSDEEKSTGNEISAGTLELTVDNMAGFSYNWGGEGQDPIAPGDTLELSGITLENTGSIDAAKIVMETNVTSSTTENGGNLEEAIEVNVNDGEITKMLSELDGTGEEIGDGLAVGSTKGVEATLTFDSDAANNDHQGASLVIEHIFHLFQDQSQSV